MQINEAILAVIEQDGYTQTHIADQASIEFSKFNKWLRGNGRLHDQELARLLGTLKMSLVDEHDQIVLSDEDLKNNA